MALVKEYMDGNCKMHIYDDYITKDKNEIDKIIKEASEIYSKYFSKYPDHYKNRNPIHKN